MADVDGVEMKIIDEEHNKQQKLFDPIFATYQFKQMLAGITQAYCLVVTIQGQACSFHIDDSELIKILGESIVLAFASLKKKLAKCHPKERLVFALDPPHLFAQFLMIN